MSSRCTANFASLRFEPLLGVVGGRQMGSSCGQHSGCSSETKGRIRLGRTILETDGAQDNAEIYRLRRGINDLASLLSLPAIWIGRERSLIATTLVDVLVRMLGLDFAYVRISDPAGGSPDEAARLGGGVDRGIPAREVGGALRRLLPDAGGTATLRTAHPFAEGTVSIVTFPLGVLGRLGQFAACSARSGFPTDIERLLLRVATNQAVLALQEAAHRSRTEQMLAETEDRLRRMADSIPEVIWITDLHPEERIVCTSPSFEHIWGLPLDALYRNPRLWTETIHPEDRARVATLFSQWISGADVSYSDVEYRIVRTDGATRWIHERGVLTVDERRRPVRVSGISTDVTDRKRAEEELKRAFAEIQTLKEQLQQENIALRQEVEKTSMFEEIVGTSPPLRSILSQVSKVAPTDSTVLITGETGTGKELVARAIHKRSRRASRVFVSVNCAAIPPSLIASELFGHEKGAFTGAVQRRLGRFELANGGTIFLDEVGELPAETQMALLRVLQEHEIERVGGGRPMQVDVRVIAATNKDLAAAVAAKEFRADLFYRLNVFPVEVPALRERPADIPLLVEYFAHRYAGQAGKKIHRVARKTLDLLQSYHWPGNVRELQNVIERAVIVSESETLSVDARWLAERPTTPRASGGRSSSTLASRERDAIEFALTESKGRVAGPFGAATKLGVPSSTLESKIKALRIDKRRFKDVDPLEAR